MPRTSKYSFVRIDVAQDEVEHWSNVLWDLGADGLEQRDAETLFPSELPSSVTLLGAFQSENLARSALSHLPHSTSPAIEFVFGDEWREAWKAYFKPTRIGKGLLLCPSWELEDPDEDEARLVIDPGGAFGSGIHATTRLMLRELTRWVRKGDRLLDVGCGSGILGIAAIKLGAAQVEAIDIDETALIVANENARRNGVEQSLSASWTSLEQVTGVYDVVLANIQAQILIELAQSLVRRLRPGAHLMMSGVLEGEVSEVRNAFEALNFCYCAQEQEWVTLVFRNRF